MRLIRLCLLFVLLVINYYLWSGYTNLQKHYEYKLLDQSKIEQARHLLQQKIIEPKEQDLILFETEMQKIDGLDFNMDLPRSFDHATDIIPMTLDGSIQADHYLFDLLIKARRMFPGYIKVRSLELKKIQDKHVHASVSMYGYILNKK